MAEDRDLTIWLAENVLGLKLGELGQDEFANDRLPEGCYCMVHCEMDESEHFCSLQEWPAIHQTGDAWFPLERLDECRLLEDRLRELELDVAYKDQLVAVVKDDRRTEAWEKYQAIAVFADGLDPAMAVLHSTARQKCEAVRRTWLQRKESEGKK